MGGSCFHFLIFLKNFTVLLQIQLFGINNQKKLVERVVLVANQRQIIDIRYMSRCHSNIPPRALCILLENDVTRFARVLVGHNLPGDLRLKCCCTRKRRESLQPGVAR